MAINWTSDIVGGFYSRDVAARAAYQSPGTYNIPSTFYAGGGIGRIRVTRPGVITSVPTVTISGNGSSATATATAAAQTVRRVQAAGTGYVVGDVLTVSGGTRTVAAKLTVAALKLVRVAVNAGGRGYRIGDTITLQGGTATTKAVLTVATVNTGAVATFTITTAGNYSVGRTTFTQARTSGRGTGATFETGVFGVLRINVSTAGTYSVIPRNPVRVTGGTGSSGTFNLVWGVGAVTVTAAGDNYTRATVGFSRGTATASVVLEPSDREKALLTLVEVVRSYLARCTRADEARVAQMILRRMTAFIRGGRNFSARTMAANAQAAALRWYAGHQRLAV